MPRLASSTFAGEFPFATIDFHDPDLPVRLSLEAFPLFMPIVDDSGLPIAVLRYRVSNRSTQFCARWVHHTTPGITSRFCPDEGAGPDERSILAWR
jgi:uncharacterized protein (DUF608 family)